MDALSYLMLGNSVLCLIAAVTVVFLVKKGYDKKSGFIRALQYLYFCVLVLFSFYNASYFVYAEYGSPGLQKVLVLQGQETVYSVSFIAAIFAFYLYKHYNKKRLLKL